jgi:Lon protease-like protein
VTERIPLFPLGSVLFPGLLLPLHIFEERYRMLVRTLLEQPEEEGRAFGVVAIREGREVGADGVRALHEVGCAAELRGVESYPDGRFDIVTTGANRFRLVEVDESLPYLQADVEWLDEPTGDDVDVLASSVGTSFLSYRAALLATQGQEDDGGGLPDDPLVLSYLIGAAMVLDLPDKQAVLAAPSTGDRLRLELNLLRREDSVLRRLPSLPGVEYTRQPYSAN